MIPRRVFGPCLLAFGITCLFSLSPDGAMAEESFLAEGAEVKKLASDMKFTEGPVWIPSEEKLIFSDIPNNRLMQWSEGEGLSLYRDDSQNTNGNILDLEGKIVSCRHSGRDLLLTQADGSTEVIVAAFDGKRFNSPNDVAVNSDGSLWFTDPSWGLKDGKNEYGGHWVFRWDPKTKKAEPVIKDLAMPNGINFSPDESRLYVADTGGNQRHPDASMHSMPDIVRCYEMNADGSLGKKLFDIPGGSDGMAVDVEGNLYTTHEGSVHVFTGDGKRMGEIPVPEGPANCTFGGEDFKTLFITARNSLYSVRLKNAGAKPKGAQW